MGSAGQRMTSPAPAAEMAFEASSFLMSVSGIEGGLAQSAQEAPARTDGFGGRRLTELYLAHVASVTRLAYLLTGDHALAEDFAHEAFVRVAGRFSHLRNPDAFPAYLRSTVVNLSRMHFRRLKTERKYLAREASLRPSEYVGRDLGDADALQAALLRLPERQRTAIVLRYYEDLSYDVTAEILRCEPATARSLVARGMQQLRLEVGDGYTE
jgi:RNA polymerase sigma factor (sigma-70 family)